MTSHGTTADLHESRDSLWLLAAAPAIWAAHLLACYITESIVCAKVVDSGASPSWTSTVVWYTAIALAGIAVVGWSGLRRHRHGTETTTHDLDSPLDRHQFLGFATLLLSGLSATAVLYAAFASAYFEGCG